MTDMNTFTNDQGNTNTSFSDNLDADNNNQGNAELGNKLQQQVDVMQKRITDKDTHITTIESENQTLREKMLDIESKIESMGSVEDALARMNEAKNSNQDTALDEDTLVSKVLGRMDAKTAEETATANFNDVSATLTKTYGKDQVDSIVRKAADENGLSFEDMFDLARKSPQALYRMVGIKQAVNTSTATPSQSTQSGYASDNQNRDQQLSDFAKLRRENAKEFYKPEVQKAFRELCLNK